MVKVTLWTVTACEKHICSSNSVPHVSKLPSESCSYYPLSTRGEKAEAETDPILHITSQMYLFNILTVEIGFRALTP